MGPMASTGLWERVKFVSFGGPFSGFRDLSDDTRSAMRREATSTETTTPRQGGSPSKILHPAIFPPWRDRKLLQQCARPGRIGKLRLLSQPPPTSCSHDLPSILRAA